MIEAYKPYLHYNVELEKAIIGVALLEKLAFSRAVGIIENPEIFYSTAHREIYKAMMEMYKMSLPIDLLTVADYLINRKDTSVLNGSFTPYYLTLCTHHVVSGANVEYHSHIVREMWKRRKVVEIKYSAMEDDGLDPRKNIEEINRALSRLTDTDFKKDWYDMSELMIQLYKHQDEMRLTGGIGVLTGFPTIDKETGGFFGGNMVFIGARPSVGKSALANTIAIKMAKNNKKVGIISLEMSNIEIAARIAAIDTNTDYSIVYRGLQTDEREMQRMYEKITAETVGLPIFVSDKANVNMFDIRGKAERLMSKEGLDVLIIDYIQLIETSDSRNSSRENEIGKISRGMKVLAKDLNIPVIVLGQLNREVTKRKGQDRYPVLSDIRESDTLGQDSDVVIFLHSDYMSGHTEDAAGQSTEGQTDLVIRKWRNAKKDYIVPLNFEGRKMKFTERANMAFDNIPTYNTDDDAPF